MLRKTFLFLLITFWWSCNRVYHQLDSAVLEQLKADEKIASSLFFYPSTLRVINLADNPEFYQLIGKVKRLVLYQLKEEWTTLDIMEVKSRLEKEEFFEEYASIRIRGQRIIFMGKQDPAHSIILLESDKDYFIADILGSIDFSSLSRLVQQVSKGGKQKDDYLDIFSLMGGKKRTSEETDSSSVDGQPVPVTD